MKNCPGSPGLETAPLDAEERVRPDGVGPAHGQQLASRQLGERLVALSHKAHAWIPIRSWSDSADSARAFAIACTAAAAPEMVVMQGTRATSAASRMR